MSWLTWLWIGTPLKFALWLGNRLLTWTGLFYLWRKFRARRMVWPILIAINLVSLSILAVVFFLLHRHAGH